MDGTAMSVGMRFPAALSVPEMGSHLVLLHKTTAAATATVAGTAWIASTRFHAHRIATMDMRSAPLLGTTVLAFATTDGRVPSVMRRCLVMIHATETVMSLEKCTLERVAAGASELGQVPTATSKYPAP